MAEVFLAAAGEAAHAGRLVVLKSIWPELAADPEFVQMFRDEARLLLRISHPNIVQTLEVVDDGRRLAIAMEYLDGQPLTRILNRLRAPSDLSLSLRLRVLIDALAGLHHAHELTDYDGTPMGVVHRDVSPHNVFITYDGQVKLVDFGVAKSLASAHQTRPGAIKGKLAYMAPEQLRGPRMVDRRADIFSVGVMLWEMLAGRRLWQGMTEAQIVRHLSSGAALPAVPAEALAELGAPAALGELCARALAVDPQDRIATAAELEEALTRELADAADSHARNLGRTVSVAFEEERMERRRLIEAALRSDAAGTLAIEVGPADMVLGEDEQTIADPEEPEPAPARMPVAAAAPPATMPPADPVALPWPVVGARPPGHLLSRSRWAPRIAAAVAIGLSGLAGAWLATTQRPAAMAAAPAAVVATSGVPAAAGRAAADPRPTAPAPAAVAPSPPADGATPARRRHRRRWKDGVGLPPSPGGDHLATELSAAGGAERRAIDPSSPFEP